MSSHPILKLVKVPPAVFFLGLASLFGDVASEMIYPLLPLFLTEVMGASVLFIGVLEGIANSVASLTKLFSGYYSDRVRKRTPFVLAGYTLAGVARPLIGFISTPWQVLSIRITDRIGKGLREAPRDAWLAFLATTQTRGKIFGFHRAMDHVGAIVGPLFATLFLFLFPGEYRPLFLLAFLPGLFSVFSVIAAKRATTAEMSSAKTPLTKLRFRELLKLPPRFKHYLLIVALFTLGNASDAFLLLKIRASGVADAWLPLLWAGLHVIKAATSIWGGQFSDRHGRKKAIIMGWALYAVIYFAFSQIEDMAAVIALFMVYALYFALTEGPEKALVADLVSAEKHGTAFGFYHLVLGIGALPASLIFGILWQKVGMSTAFCYGAALAGLSSLLLFFLPLPHRKPTPLPLTSGENRG